jgi:hypothetical protein
MGKGPTKRRKPLLEGFDVLTTWPEEVAERAGSTVTTSMSFKGDSIDQLLARLKDRLETEKECEEPYFALIRIVPIRGRRLG